MRGEEEEEQRERFNKRGRGTGRVNEDFKAFLKHSQTCSDGRVSA